MEMMKKLNFAKILGWIFLLILVGSSIFVGVNFRQAQDYFKAKSFNPSAEILQIVEKIKRQYQEGMYDDRSVGS